MEASEFREVCSRYGCLNKVAKLLYESIEDVQRKEAVFTHSGNSRLDQDGQQIESIVKPLQFSIETAISCLNLLHNYVSRNKNESSQVFREITFNIAKVRGVEYISTAFTIRHQYFVSRTEIYRDLLQMRCLSLRVLSGLELSSSLIAEIAYQGALEKIVWTYTNRFLSLDSKG